MAVTQSHGTRITCCAVLLDDLAFIVVCVAHAIIGTSVDEGLLDMPTIHFGTTPIDYCIKHSPSITDVVITVDWTSGVSVAAPKDIGEDRVEAALRTKAKWMLRKLAEFREIQMPTVHREFISGEKIPYLGRQYRLKVNMDSQEQVSILYQNGRFIASVPKVANAAWRQEQLHQAFRAWYMTHGLSKIEQRVKLFAPRLGVHVSKIMIKDQQARWGSCTKNGTVNINWRILMAPMRIVDYVVVHELAHLIHADHSSEFWTVVGSVMPDYHARKEWLRVHGATLEL